jgi:hypothetical protein
LHTPSLSARELALVADTDVIGHIRRENAQRQARMDAVAMTPQPGLICMMVAESVADRAVNVYEYERDMELGTYSDVHKEFCGFRPRQDFSQWTLEDFERANKDLFKEVSRISETQADNADDLEAEKAYWAEEEDRMAKAEEYYRDVARLEAQDLREEQEYTAQDTLSGV